MSLLSRAGTVYWQTQNSLVLISQFEDSLQAEFLKGKSEDVISNVTGLMTAGTWRRHDEAAGAGSYASCGVLSPRRGTITCVDSLIRTVSDLLLRRSHDARPCLSDWDITAGLS